MSHSRKKVYLSDFSQLSATEKVRGTSKGSLFRRKCCDKENQCSRQCRSKDETKSLKKNLKKKYLEEEVEKVLQKRYQNTGNVIKELREQNTNEIEGLREDLKSMKDVIYKLSIEDHCKGKEERQVLRQPKENRGNKITEDVRMELSSQMETNMRLKSSLRQSEQQARQAKKEAETLKNEVAQLTQNLSSLQKEVVQLSTVRKQLQESQAKNKELQLLLKEACSKAQKADNQLEVLKNSSQAQQKTNANEISQLKTKIQALILQISQSKSHSCRLEFENQKLEKQKTTFEQQFQQKCLSEQKIIKQVQKLRNDLKGIKEKYKAECSEKHRLEAQVNKTRLQLNKTSIDLGNTKTKLGGLASMQKKCEELYEEIKKEKCKWNQFSLEKTTERETYEEQIAILKNKVASIQDQLKDIEQKHKEEKEVLKAENYRLLEDKIKLSKELKNKQTHKGQQQQLTMMEMKVNTLEQTLKESEIERVKEKVRLTNRIQTLQQGIKKFVEENNETKVNLEAIKKQNMQNQKEYMRTKQEKEQIQSALAQAKEQSQKQKASSNEKSKELNNQISNLKALLSQSSENVNEIQQQLLKANEQTKSLKTIIQQLQQQSKKKSAQINSQKGLIEAYLKAKCDADDQNIVKEKELQQLRQKLSQSENKVLFQQGELKAISSKIEKTEALLQQAIQNSTKNESKVRITIIELEQQYETVKVKLEVTQKQSQEWKEKNQENEKMLETQRQRYEECQQKLKDSQSLQISLSEQLSSLQQTSQRNQQQLNWYEQEINIKNKSIAQLKQTIKAVKNESILIREEVDTYRSDYMQLQELKNQETARSGEITKKYEELQQFTMDQIYCMRERLDELAQAKVNLETQIALLHQRNEGLEKKIVELDNEDLREREREACMQRVRIAEEKTIEKEKEIEEIRNASFNEIDGFKNELCLKEKQLQMINSILEEQRASFARQMMEIQSSSEYLKTQIEQHERLRLQSQKMLEEKQETIYKLTEKTSSFQQKKARVISEVQEIQVQLMELSERNNCLQSENETLQLQNKEKQEKIKIYQQKINILIESKYALEEQKIALEQQSQILQQQISKAKNREKTIEEEHQKKINETFQSCEKRKNQIVESLKSKVLQVSNELTLIKSGQLTQIKGERQKLISMNNQKNSQIQSLQLQMQSKQREYECLVRDRTITREKLNEVQSKYLSLLKKYEQSEQERCLSQRELESQSAALRVLRDQNKNIEKVMSDQLSQRTAIIEQLVNEKRMLYTQFQHQ